MRKAFSLVELLIVVAILGILAAVVVPIFQGHALAAKEAAAKDNLRVLRNAIELYATRHNGIPPGYPNDNTTSNPSYMAFGRAMTEIEHYLSKIPQNPFNQKSLTKVLKDTDSIPTQPVDISLYGWIYQPLTKTIKLNWPGTDSKGISFMNY